MLEKSQLNKICYDCKNFGHESACSDQPYPELYLLLCTSLAFLMNFSVLYIKTFIF